MSFKIRKARDSDLGVCTKIFVTEMNKQGEKWTLKTGRERLNGLMFLMKNRRGANFCLLLDGRVIGFIFNEICVWGDGKQLYVSEFVIDSDFQGKGYGLKALKFVESFAGKNKLNAITLLAYKKGKVLKLYRKFGAKPAGLELFKKEI